MKALVRIGTFDFPQPLEYESTTVTLVDSGRNIKGVAIGAVIREDVAKVSMSWNFLSTKQWADISKCFLSKYGGGFYRNVTFFCQDSGTWETRKMYVSDRVAKTYRVDPKTGAVLGYENPKLSLVEV